MRLHVLTGAPGSGKTTLLTRLRGRGLRYVPEPARELLAEHRAALGSTQWDPSPDMFVEMLLARSVRKYEEAQRQPGTVVFDRGIPDCIAYALHLGIDPEPSSAAARAYRYQSDVLVTPPWEEIYTTDEERTMSFDATIAFHARIEEAYERSGYALVEVPLGPIETRVRFIERFVAGR